MPNIGEFFGEMMDAVSAEVGVHKEIGVADFAFRDGKVFIGIKWGDGKVSVRPMTEAEIADFGAAFALYVAEKAKPQEKK